MQITLHIAIRCVLHRCVSREIHCWKLFFHCFNKKSKNFIKYTEWRDLEGPTPDCFQRKNRVVAFSKEKARDRSQWIPSDPSIWGKRRKFNQRHLGIEIRGLCIDNDPSAGSPTETLLRLLLPLNSLVCHSSQHHLSVAAVTTSIPHAHYDHSIGSSDGRCVQRAGT